MTNVHAISSVDDSVAGVHTVQLVDSDERVDRAPTALESQGGTGKETAQPHRTLLPIR